MNVEELLQHLKKLRINVSVSGEQISLEDPDQKLTQGLLESIKAQKRNILAFIGSKVKNLYHTQIFQIEEQESYKLSYAQHRLWAFDKMGSGKEAYNISRAYNLHCIEKEVLEQVFQQLVVRHESLRTTFITVEGEPRQRVHSAAGFKFKVDYTDLRSFQDKEARARELANSEAMRAFDLEQGPLIRAGLLQMSDTDYVFLMTIHHIICDGWSMAVLFNEILSLYDACKKKQPSSLPPLQIQYKDYATWQNGQLTEASLQQHKAYWMEQFSGEVPVLNLPTDFPRPATKTYNGSTKDFLIDKDLARGIAKLSQERGVTLFVTLLASVNTLLHRYTSQNDIVVGAPIAGREHPDLGSLIGLFINTLAIRTKFTKEDSFNELLDKTRTVAINAFANQNYPLDQLLEDLGIGRDMSRSPLFDVLVVLNNTDIKSKEEVEVPEDLEVNLYSSEFNISKFDLQFTFFEHPQGITLALNYNTDLFTGSRIERLLAHYEKMLRSILEEATAPIGTLSYLSEAEEHQLLHEFNSTAAAYPQGKTVIELFKEATELYPGEPAVICGEHIITYRRLDELSNQLAHYLIQEGSVRPGDYVGIMMERTENVVVSMLAVLKAGGAFVPVDFSYPDERIHFLLEDAGVQVVVLDDEKCLSRLGTDSFKFITLAEDREQIQAKPVSMPEVECSTTDIAYMMYTSGSSGRPKGVIISQESLINYVNWANEYYFSNKRGYNFALFTSIAFDLTNTSIFTTLLRGDSVLIYNESWNISDVLVEVFREGSNVQAVKLTPSHITLLNYLPVSQSSVGIAIVGGEALTQGQVNILTRLNKEIRLFNEYGPTEATIGCTVAEINEGDPITIGKPIGNAQIYILDENQQLLPEGVVGEICIGGKGISQGYHNRPELTASKFVKNPFVEGEKVYLSGDLGKWLPDGTIELSGRKDTQVKIRGYRVELEEIENELNKYEEILQCVVDIKHFKGGELTEVHHCVECGIPSNYPDLVIDDNGVCSMCVDYERYKEEVEKYFKTEEDLQEILSVSKSQQEGGYDCLLLFSGGKDSTYVLCKLIKEYKLKVLAFTLDNGYISDEAKENIDKVTQELGVDHIYGRTPFMNDIFVDSLKRYSNVCDGCYKTIYTLAVNLANEKKINCIITGLSRGQLFETRLHHLYNSRIFDVTQIDEKIIEARHAYHQIEDAATKCLNTSIFKERDIFQRIQIIDFYRYTQVALEDVYKYINQYVPWIRPSDTGRSTNCLINELGIYIHKREKKHHNYALPYSWDVRLGHKTKEEAMDELDDELDMSSINQKLYEIGYSEYLTKTPDTEDLLVAYYVSKEPVDPARVKASLSKKLMDYMIPQIFVRMESLPLTANGKVNRAKLPAGIDVKALNKVAYVAPSNEIEEKLAAYWKKTLIMDDIGVNDKYFSLGGTSIKIVMLHAFINSEYPGILKVSELFDFATIKEQAQLIQERTAVETDKGESEFEVLEY